MHKFSTFLFLLLFVPGQVFPAIGTYRERPRTPLVPIHEIQGVISDQADALAHQSPFNNRFVQVQGVVHQRLTWATRKGEARYGVLLQTAATHTDGNPNTSDGLLFYSGDELAIPKKNGQFTPQVGDEIIVSGLLKERYGQTELGEVQLESLLRRGLDLNKQVPAIPVNPPSDTAEAMRYWERLEGMRVIVPDGVQAVSAQKIHSATLDAIIEVINPDHVVTKRKNPYQQRVFRDPHPLDDEADTLFDNGNGYRYLLSSFGIKATERNHRAMMQATHTFSGLVGERTGGVLFNWDRFKVAITEQPIWASATDPAKNHPPPPPQDESTVSIASYNVENLYDRRNDPDDGCDFPDDPGCDGVRKPYDYVPEHQNHYKARLVKIARHIVDDLHAPDLIMIQELEDQDAFPQDGKNDALHDLTVAIRKLGGPAYGIGSDRRGADARGIVCGFMYRSDRISPLRARRWHPVLGRASKVHQDYDAFADNLKSRNPKAFNATSSWTNHREQEEEGSVFSRAVQVAGFQVFPQSRNKGKPRVVYLLNNHFSSRPDRNVERRRQQAAFNADLYRALKKSSKNALVVVGGDLNVYPRPDDPLPDNPSDQLAALYDAGMSNLYDHLLEKRPEAAYTYIYQGQAQTLDHLFVGPLLREALVDVFALHVNADYPYSTQANEPYGASDHDPLLARFKLW